MLISLAVIFASLYQVAKIDDDQYEAKMKIMREHIARVDALSREQEDNLRKWQQEQLDKAGQP